MEHFWCTRNLWCWEISLLCNFCRFVANQFSCNIRYFVAEPVLSSSQYKQFLCGEKLSPKFCPLKKNDKYCVCWVTNRGKAKQDISWSGVERIESIFHQLCWPASKSLLASNCPKLSYFAIFDKIYIFDANYFPFPISLLLIYKV